MSIETKKAILSERNQVFEPDFKVQLMESCSIENGILRLTKEEGISAMKSFEESNKELSFFIPASGSGSRMFGFLYKWLENGQETDEIKRFFDEIENFPFYSELKSDKNNRTEIVQEIIENYAKLPKGLIPFHQYDNGSRTAFQEQTTQIKYFFGENAKVHFTIQKEVKNLIEENLSTFDKLSFSFQNEDTNAFCFDQKGEVVKEGNHFLRRPAGHGALLENLNALDAEIVLLKNIDNVQHFSEAKKSANEWRKLVGVLLAFKKELKNVAHDFSTEKLIALNKKYPFLFPDDIDKITPEDCLKMIAQPTRVCGMVKNEGEPGGGPFWIQDDNRINNQIIEKAQIHFENEQQAKIVNESSHFNPVFIAVSKTDGEGNPIDLMSFRDDSKFFVVEKTHQGKKIFYRELPGLWNGSMSNWNTIFVEIPLDVFTPVKSVLDLLE